MIDMSEVLHANVFFFITGIAVIVFTSLLCVVLFHSIKILQSIRRIMLRIEHTTNTFGDDIERIRDHMASGGVIGKLMHFLFGIQKKDGERGNDTSSKQKSATRKQNTLKIKDES